MRLASLEQARKPSAVFSATPFSSGRWALLFALGFASCADVTSVVGRVNDAEVLEPSGGQGPAGTGGDAASPGGGLGVGGESGALFSFEAEDGQLSGDFHIVEAADASQMQAIEAVRAAEPSGEPGSARAMYQFEVTEAGEYVIYGRIHSPGASENRFWFRVDDGAWFLWRISTGEEWYWDDLHDNFEYGAPLVFSLTAGSHQLELANAVTGARLDRFEVALAGTPPPAQAPACNPPHSILLSGSCVRSCGSYGDVSCIFEECADREELVAYDCAICCLP